MAEVELRRYCILGLAEREMCRCKQKDIYRGQSKRMCKVSDEMVCHRKLAQQQLDKTRYSGIGLV